MNEHEGILAVKIVQICERTFSKSFPLIHENSVYYVWNYRKLSILWRKNLEESGWKG